MEELAAGPSPYVLSPDQGFTKETGGHAAAAGQPCSTQLGRSTWAPSQEGKWVCKAGQAHQIQAFLGNKSRDSPRGPVAKTPCPQCRGPGFNPGQGARSHMPQLRPSVAK